VSHWHLKVDFTKI